jgi:peptidylprolyl isomerase
MICSIAFAGCVNPAGNTTFQNATPLPSVIRAADGDRVTVDYTGMFENGTVFDSSKNDQPLTFTLGNSSVISGFQDAVIGMAVTDQKTVTIPFQQAYGPYRPDLVRTVPRIGPLANKTFTVGQLFAITRNSDQAVSVVRILNETPDNVTWDANNPLAGLNLTYRFTVTDINRKNSSGI